MEARAREPEHEAWRQPAIRVQPTGRRDPILTLASLGFVVCPAIAIGYGLWALYGSGSKLASLDALGGRAGAPATLGPVALEPGMNPLRAVLRAGYAPVGSTRIRYEIELVDAAGRRSWMKAGALGSRDDEASIVWTTTSLMVFDVASAGEYGVNIRFADGSMDDLREASVELRRNVVRADARIPWGFGLAAAACLIVNLVAVRRQPWPYRPAEHATRPAA